MPYFVCMTNQGPVVNLEHCIRIRKVETSTIPIKYAIEFVGCAACWSFNTELERENVFDKILALDCVHYII